MISTHASPTFRAAPHRTAAPLSARVAVYGAPAEPPLLEELRDPDPAVLVERLYEAVAGCSRLPVVAVREVIENLVHAGFRDALVSVMESGSVVRVSDSGPGIADVPLAMEPGFTTAGPDERRVIRGAGCGLPLAAQVVGAEGGDLVISGNLGGGTVVTVSVPRAEAGEEPDEPGVPEDARVLMALLLEVGPSRPERLAAELGWPVSRCGRELVLLEARGLVGRADGGVRALTTAGSTLLATLF